MDDEGLRRKLVSLCMGGAGQGGSCAIDDGHRSVNKQKGKGKAAATATSSATASTIATIPTTTTATHHHRR